MTITDGQIEDKRIDDADADLIVYAPTDIASLITEVERLTRLWKTAMRGVVDLRAENEKLRAVAEAAEDHARADADTSSQGIVLRAMAADHLRHALAALDTWRGGA